MLKRSKLFKWVIVALSVVLVFPSVPPVLAEGNQPIDSTIMMKESSENTDRSKIDSQLLQEFDKNEYVTYIVKLREQLDVESVSKQAEQWSLFKYETAAKRKLTVRNVVINSLEEVAERSQADLVSYIQRMKKSGEVKEYNRFFIVNAIAITSTKEFMEKIASRPEVEKVVPNKKYHLEYEKGQEEVNTYSLNSTNDDIPWNLKNINVKQVWDMGYDGSGIVLANMDSGVDYTHPALQRKWRGYDANGNIINPELNWYDATSERKPLPFDGDGHGTHVMGTMVGSEPEGNKIGVAPNAKWIAVRIFDSEGVATDEGIIEAAQWILAPKDAQGNRHPDLAPDVVNNSWGNVSPEKDEFLRDIVIAWRAANIFPVFAAGNSKPENPGGPGSVSAPAHYPESFAVGAVDKNNKLASFSLWGPSPYGEIKPEVSAPGVGIRSAMPGGGYQSLSGTSMAAPHTAAVAGLLLQADHSLTVDQIEEILMNSAVPYTDNNFHEAPNNGYGWGVINAYNAITSLQNGLGAVEGQVTIDGIDTDGPVIEHDPITLTFNALDQDIYARVRDQISVVNVELKVRTRGASDWNVYPMTRFSGDHLDGQYEGFIPVDQLVTEGIEYQIRAVDYSGNESVTEIYQVEVSEGVKLGYKNDFETNINGFDFGGDPGIWEWGEPTSGPGRAYSGTKVMATKLHGKYPNGVISFMVSPLIDLRDGNHTILSFTHWYKLGHWWYAIPDRAEVFIGRKSNGFQFERVKYFEWSNTEWNKEYVDLSPYNGDQIYIIFNLYGVNGSDDGWYIDDIELIGPDQIPPPAPTIRARTNAPGKVIIEWGKPASGNIMEYVIYRSTQSGGPYEQIGTSRYSNFADFPMPQKGTYYYIVKAKSHSHILSEASNEVSWTFTGGTEIFSDNFDGPDDNGWTLEGTINDWQRGIPDPNRGGPTSAVSSPNVWGTNLSGNYSRNANMSLISPTIDLTSAQHASIYFQYWNDIDTDAGDSGFLEISKDGGQTWELLARYPKYPSKWWTLDEIGIDSYVGHQIKVRFRLKSNANSWGAGWYIDDFEVRDTVPVKSSSLNMYSEEGTDQEKIANGANTNTPESIPTLEDLRAYHKATQISTAENEGLPAAATVTIIESERSTKTDPGTGHYTLKHPPGDYNMRIEAYGYQTVNLPVSIMEGQTATVNVHLQPLPKGWITGKITDKLTGEPIVGASVRVMEDAHVTPEVTDENGEYTLEVYEGGYHIMVSALGYYSDTAQVAVSGDQTVSIDRSLSPFAGVEDELAYDDGTADNALASTAFAVRMTTDGSAQVTGARFYFWTEDWPTPGGTDIQYAIYDANGEDGAPGDILSGPYHGTAKRDGTWTEVTFQNPVIVDGDFYVVYIQSGDYPNVPGLGSDKTGEFANRSWILSGDQWYLAPSSHGNYMIRAKVTDITGSAVHSIEVQPAEVAMKVGETSQLSVTASVYQDGVTKTVPITEGLKFTSEDPSIAEVDHTGLVIAKKSGETNIVVEYGEFVATAKVTVTGPEPEPGPEPEILSIEVHPTEVAMKVGETSQLSVTASVYQDGVTKTVPITEGLKFTSEDPSIAEVNQTGLVTAKKSGETNIVVEYKGFVVKAKVTIEAHLDPQPEPDPNPLPPPSTPPTSGEKVGVGTVSTSKNADGSTSATISVSGEVITKQLQDQNAANINLDLSDVKLGDFKEVAATLDKSTTEKLLASNKGLLINVSGFAVEIPANALADFITSNGFKIILSVSEASNGTVQVQSVEITSIVSPIVTVKSDSDKLSNPIKITLKPTAKLVSDARKVGVYQKTEDGKWTFVGANSVRKKGDIELTVSKLGSYAAIEYQVTFADIVNHWAKDEIEVIASQHVTKGKSEIRFAPNEKITRAEFMALLDRILGTKKDWSEYEKIEGATQVLDREEMVVMMVNALGVDLSEVQVELSFKDQESISENARSAIAFAVNNGLIKGVGDNKFAPKQSSTRAQVAVILYRLMQLLGKF